MYYGSSSHRLVGGCELTGLDREHKQKISLSGSVSFSYAIPASPLRSCHHIARKPKRALIRVSLPKGRPGSPRYCSLAPTVSVTWPCQSGISGPRSTAPAEVRGGVSLCSIAAAGSSAGALSGSTVGAGGGEILFGSPSAAAGCTSFSSTVGGLSGSTVVSGAADILFGSTAAAAGCTSFGSTRGVLFCSTAAAGSSAGVFVSCAGRGRGSGGDDSIRWRCAPVPVTWWNQVITSCAILETGGRALGGVGGCGPCAWADAAATSWRDRKNVAAPNTLDLMVRPPAARDNEREAVSWRSTNALK
jgi:hypothetical protein